MDDEFLVVVLGACNTGKSFLINAVTNESKCKVSNDGQPTTLQPVLVSSKDTIYIDTPGLQKSSTKMSTLKFPNEFRPSLIWLVINFQAAIENSEFNILDAIPDAAVVLILNKVNLYRKEALENFGRENFVTRHQKLTLVHRRLMEEKKNHPNIHHIIPISFQDEDHTDSQVIGINRLQEITNEYMQKHKADAQSDDGPSLSIAIVGYSSNGKSSMVNAISSESRMAAISSDGGLCTQQWTCYQTGRLKLWDCPAIPKRSEVDAEYSTMFNLEVRPDIIWFIVNYKNVDIDDEHELCNILKIDKNIPVIVIINKVDFLHKMKNLADADLVEFSKQQPLEIFSKKTNLLNIRQQIYEKWLCFMKVEAVTISSLFNGDDEETGQSTPIGINALLDITHRYLEDNQHRGILDTLTKHENKWIKRGSSEEKMLMKNIPLPYICEDEPQVSDNAKRTFWILALFFVGGIATIFTSVNNRTSDLWDRVRQAYYRST